MLAALLASAGPAWGQNADPIFDDATQSYPSNEFLRLANQYLDLQMRIPELARTINPGSGNTPPSFVGWSNYRGGRVFFSTTNGDPFTSADNGVDITNRVPYSTKSTIRLSTTPVGAGTDEDQFETYEVESLYSAIDDPTQEIFLERPVLGNRGLTFTWQVRQDNPEVTDLTDNTEILDNDALAGEDSEPRVAVKQTYSLVRDMVRVEVEVINVSLVQQYVGVETYLDASFGGPTDDGTEFYVTGSSQALQREISFPVTSTSAETALRRIPETWRSFDDITQPGVVLGGVFGGADVATADGSAGLPDEAMFVNANLAGPSVFRYRPLGLDLNGANWGVLVRWEDVLISPGQSRKFITYFGLAGADSDFEQPYVLSVEAPFSLELASGDDPSTPAQEPDSHVYRSPNPFQLRAFMTNIGTRALSDLNVSVALPQGLSLADPTDTITKNIATLPAGTEVEVNWDLRSEAGQLPGNQTITVSAAGNGVPSKVVIREIGIPALPLLQFPSITRRLDMISVPFDFANRDLQNIFGSLGNLGVTGGGNAALARFHPDVRAYAFFPDPFITTLRPGEGVWLFNGSLADLALPADRFEVSTAESVGVALNPDWNQLGCPYTVPARLFDCEVVTTDNVTRTFDAAVAAGIVRPVLYEYQPHPLDPSETGSYLFEGDSNTAFNPWRGYWLRTLQPITLVYNAAGRIGPFRGAQNDLLALRQGWEAALRVTSGERAAQPVRFGQDVGALEGYDVRDVDAPPPVRMRDALQVSFVNSEWGRNAGLYLRDIRPSAARSTRWLARADCDRPNATVTLRWDLRAVPGDIQLTLVDLETGARRQMRTTAGYTYNTGALGRSRMFEVKATRGGGGRLSIPFVETKPGRAGGTQITFSLSQPADAEVVIESPSGRRVRTLSRSLAAEAGQNALVWDGRDDARRRVPAGAYRCRIMVHTPDGQQAVAERFVIVR